MKLEWVVEDSSWMPIEVENGRWFFSYVLSLGGHSNPHTCVGIRKQVTVELVEMCVWWLGHHIYYLKSVAVYNWILGEKILQNSCYCFLSSLLINEWVTTDNHHMLLLGDGPSNMRTWLVLFSLDFGFALKFDLGDLNDINFSAFYLSFISDFSLKFQAASNLNAVSLD